MPTYTSHYPAFDTDHVKATSYYSAGYAPWFACDPSKSLTGNAEQSNVWHSASQTTNQRFHIDLGSGHIIKRIYYENFHNSGTELTLGVNAFTFWGSNEATAFAELTYGTDTDWTQLTTDIANFVTHSAADESDPHYVVVTNSTSYQYYAIKIATNLGGTPLMSVRRFELQTEDGGGTYLIPTVTTTDTPNAPSINTAFPPSVTTTDTSNAPGYAIGMTPASVTTTDTPHAPTFAFAWTVPTVYTRDTANAPTATIPVRRKRVGVNW